MSAQKLKFFFLFSIFLLSGCTAQDITQNAGLPPVHTPEHASDSLANDAAGRQAAHLPSDNIDPKAHLPQQPAAPVNENKNSPGNNFHLTNDKFAPLNNHNANPNMNIPQNQAVPQKHFEQNMPNGNFVGQNDLNQQYVKPNVGISSMFLSHNVACIEDVQKFCVASKKYQLQNNFDVLECLSTEANAEDLTTECNNYIWHFKLNLTLSKEFHDSVGMLCHEAIKKWPKCNVGKFSGAAVTCLLEHREAISSPTCKSFLEKIGAIVFNDYHLIDNFIRDCQNETQRLKCGRLDSKPEQNENFLHSQEHVVHCLESYLGDNGVLSPQCETQISRLAELSADDFQMDKYLYVRCKDDRETFCRDVIAGEGRVFQCLFDHKILPDMSVECRTALTEREIVIAKDYKASSSLAHNCKLDIEKQRCEAFHRNHGTNDNNDRNTHLVQLSTIMLCLENGQKSGIPISPDCRVELVHFRKMLMSDYQVSPEVADKCASEIVDKCDKGLEREGKTLHCLFGLASAPGGLSEGCQTVLLNLIRETDVAGDYRVDQVLAKACQSVIESKCVEFQPGDPMVIGCLLEHQNDHDMNKACKNAVLDIQYFVSRDFTIDPQFHEACAADAKRLCFTEMNGPALDDDHKLERPPQQMPVNLILSCLYRHTHPNVGQKITGLPPSEECTNEVNSVLRQRALDVHLNPELESSCRKDLGKLCSDKPHESGNEFDCLQKNYEGLEPDCKKVVTSLTRLEGQDPMNFETILVKECEPMLQQFCGDLIKSADEGKIMECLIGHKEDMSSKKCVAGITHFQLIEMKDYHLDFKFMKACFDDIRKYCINQFNQSPTAEVIKCLSQKQRDHVLGDKRGETLSPKCSDQITIEKLQMHRNILLNPDLDASCSGDHEKLCHHVKTGEAQVIECLREHKKELSSKCIIQLFKFEEEESKDTNLDFQLMHTCKKDIKEYCGDEDEDNDYIFECLIQYKHRLNKECKEIVFEREKEFFSDISLNKPLMNACDSDIDKYCGPEKVMAASDHKEGKDPHGIIYECLEDKFTNKSLLSSSCHQHIELVIREKQQNYLLDPRLTLKCVDPIERLCPPKDNFNVVECLKKEYFKNTLSTYHECMLEVAKLLNEGYSDIMADPLLQQSCALELKEHCSSVPEGHGRLISCLMAAVKAEKQVSSQCFEQLQMRKEMWKKSIKGVESLSELHNAVRESENSSYIVSMLTIFILVVLFLGVCFGRITKKVTRHRRHPL